jgi:CHAD domain-containing protein
MAYQLDLRRGASRSVTRTYRKALEKAHRVLTEPGASDDPVHDGHTGVKKARMLLRLARRDLGGSRFRLENDALRDAGHALSAVRDAVVLVETIDALIERAGGEDRSGLAALRAILAERRDACTRRSGPLVVQATRPLDAARARAQGLTLAHRGWKALGPGIERAYQRGRERFHRAEATGRDEDFHALRKAVKDLTYEARFLRPLGDQRLRLQEHRLERLGSLLGDDHDLAVLRAVSFRPDEGADPAAVTRLQALVTARQDELRREALALAEGVFREATALYTARLRQAFRRARA